MYFLVHLYANAVFFFPVMIIKPSLSRPLLYGGTGPEQTTKQIFLQNRVRNCNAI